VLNLKHNVLVKGNAPGSPATAAIIKSSVARWQGTLKQLQAQSGSINYKRVPGNDRQQTQALIESIEYLSLRFASAVQVREQSAVTLDEHLLKGLGRIHDACIDSLQLISNSLTDLKPIPELPDTASCAPSAPIPTSGGDRNSGQAGKQKLIWVRVRVRVRSVQWHTSA
jgi:hypothetical protein